MPLTGRGSAPGAGTDRPVRRWHADRAWLPGRGVHAGVLIEAAGRHFTAVTPGVAPADCPPGTARLAGFTLPGLANAHSHAFHRALRGVVQAGQGTFWTWRERMYQVAGRLQPDSFLALARAVYAEMALAGITCVGEFHYLHHDTGGARYADPNEMGRVLIEAAAQAGLRITLLDTCYLRGGLSPDGSPAELSDVQRRFSDGDGAGWAERAGQLGPDEHGTLGAHARAGVAIHSVRAVPPDQMGPVVAWSHAYGAPLHAHLSEQPAENEACLAATTEADLADGIGPARALAAAGCPLSLGSDSHAVVDLLAEARLTEMGERLVSGRRGSFPAGELAHAATVGGHACLGWPEAGEITPGAFADLVTVALDTPRLAGTQPGSALESVIFAGSAADVRSVVIGGRDVVADGRHLLVADVPAALDAAISPLLAPA